MTQVSCALLTTCNVLTDDRRDLLRLLESVGAAVDADEVGQLRHFVLLQQCAPDDFAQFRQLAPEWVELIACETRLSSSRARNQLIAYYLASPAYQAAAFVGFPDDDAWYPRGALACLAGQFGADHGLQFLLTRYGPDPSSANCGRRQRVSLQRALSRGACAAIFVRADLLGKLGGFNELLGLGTTLSGGEDTEFSIRAFQLAAGQSAILPGVLVGHAAADPEKKAKYYEGGLAAIMAHSRSSPAARTALVRKYVAGVRFVLRGKLSWKGYVSAIARARAHQTGLRSAPTSSR